jgi:hypothetical protein
MILKFLYAIFAYKIALAAPIRLTASSAMKDSLWIRIWECAKSLYFKPVKLWIKSMLILPQLFKMSSITLRPNQ